MQNEKDTAVLVKQIKVFLQVSPQKSALLLFHFIPSCGGVGCHKGDERNIYYGTFK